MDTSNSYKALKCVKGKKLQLQGFCITVDTLYTEMPRPCDGVPDIIKKSRVQCDTILHVYGTSQPHIQFDSIS